MIKLVLDTLTDGASGRLSVDQGTRKLIFILSLPLVDGVFATLLVTGAVETFSSILSVAVTVFAGAGSLAVLYSYSESRRHALSMVGKAAPVLLAGALAVSLIAPVYEQLVHVERMRYVAAMVLIVIARDIARLDVLKNISAEAVLVTGILLSLSYPESVSLSLQYIVPAVLTVSVSLVVLTLASLIEPENIRMDYIRKGGALILVLMSGSLLGLEIPTEAILGLFAVSLVASHPKLESLDFKMNV